MSRPPILPHALVVVVLLSTSGVVSCDRNADSAATSDGVADTTGKTAESSSATAAPPEPPEVPTPEAVSPTRRVGSEESEEEPPGPRPNPRPIEMGAEIEESIADPASLQSDVLHFETDWYAVEVRANQRATITVEPGRGSSLQPMVTVLLPDDDHPGEWREIDSLRSQEIGEAVQVVVRFQTSGTKLITVDDARNVPKVGEDERPSNFHGGEAYEYVLRIQSGNETQ